MSQVGSFGSVPFEASSERIRTFREFERRRRARLAEHEIIDRPAKLQFQGESLAEISLGIHLDARFCDPEAEMDALGKMLADGQARVLTLGGRALGEFALEELAERLSESRRKALRPAF